MVPQHNSEPDWNGNASSVAGEYPLLFDTFDIGVICFLEDEDLSLLWANPCFYYIAGVAEDSHQERLKSLRQYFNACVEDFLTLRNEVSTALSGGGRSFRSTWCLPRQTGEFAWVKVSASLTGESVDDHKVIRAFVTDISEDMRQKEEMITRYKKKSQYFTWMMDEYVGNVYISDMVNYELLYINETACNTLGMTVDQLLGQKCYKVIQGRNTPCPFCTNDRLTEDSFYEWEFFNPVLNRNFMIKNRIVTYKGRRARIELSHDMFSTEYKLAKKDREREALLRTIPGGFARIDARDCRTVLWYGASYLDIIGYTEEEFKKELHSQSVYMSPEDMERRSILMDEVRRTGKSVVYEAKIFTRSGEVKILTTTLCYVSGENSWDGIPSFYSVGIDVTRERLEQNRQRRALEDAYESASVANNAKTNFLSSMSHDIRTPMNAIIGMAAIAQSNLSSPDKVHDCLCKINTSSRHLLSLINEVLDVSKIESGKIDLLNECIDLSELVQNVADMCRPLVAEKGQEFKISVGAVKHEKIVTDGDRLQQVFMNLLSNAVKYTPEGGNIHLSITELPSRYYNRGEFEFVFSDNGIGMSEEFVKHIFEPFSRAEDTRISKIQGTGLGMTIADNIVRMMNGTINVKTQLGVGSQFTVSIPFYVQSENEETCEDELDGRSVLVVDDDPVVCENATALLNELGMRGNWAMSGEDAVQRVIAAHEEGDDYFAVILDWKMPGMDGMETVRTIRENLNVAVPIIIISAYDYSEIEDEFVQAGADAFITKPLFKSKMLHVLQLFCSHSKMDSATAVVEETNSALWGKQILLAEDNELNREIAVELLQMQGIRVDSVENGKEAVEMFRSSAAGDYAAILMDIQMPVMNGYDATEGIRALDREDAKTIPIIALTANAFTADVGKSRSVGMSDHIAKPIDVGHLIRVLQSWIK